HGDEPQVRGHGRHPAHRERPDGRRVCAGVSGQVAQTDRAPVAIPGVERRARAPSASGDVRAAALARRPLRGAHAPRGRQNSEGMKKSSTREKQYDVTLKYRDEQGLETLGLMTNQAWRDDPKRLTFTF